MIVSMTRLTDNRASGIITKGDEYESTNNYRAADKGQYTFFNQAKSLPSSIEI
jgi:hypothetical protein